MLLEHGLEAVLIRAIVQMTLRMRHAHFAIGEAERDAWLRHMRDALDEIGLDEAYDAQLWEYLVMAAHSLVNRPSEPVRPDLGLSPA